MRVKADSNQSATRGVKRIRRSKRVSQTYQQVQPSIDQHHEEELSYQEEQARLAHLRDQAESSGEEDRESEDCLEEDNASSVEEEEELSKSGRRRTHHADEDARVSQAVEDELPPSPPLANKPSQPSANKTRRTRDTVDEEVAELSQAEQFQGQTNPNPSLPSLVLPLPLISTLVGADIQNVSSTNTYQSVPYSNDGDIILESDPAWQRAVTDAGFSSIIPMTRLERLIRIKTDSANAQMISPPDILQPPS